MKKVRDHYANKAQKEGFAARSIYKLEEMDQKVGLLKPGMRVLDLGSAPGSWVQYAAGRVGAKGSVVGIDLQPITQGGGPQVALLQGDIFETPAEVLLQGGPLFDVVLSDMAPRTTGIPSGDAARSADLVLRALELCEQVLKPEGAFLAKIFQGARLQEVRSAFAQRFAKVRTLKPKATRSESVEIFLLGSPRP